MTLQNRVDPFGRFHAVQARGGLMGNRGILHDAGRQITRTHAHQNWVACALSFKGYKREIMAPGHYTELFFLDEATAFAAGHRPCATCRRDRYTAFVSTWQAVHGAAEPGRSVPQTIDRALHKARITRAREKIIYEAALADLPDGVMFAVDDQAFLVWQERTWHWSFAGYTPQDFDNGLVVSVLTPQPIVEVFRAGYRPEVRLADVM